MTCQTLIIGLIDSLLVLFDTSTSMNKSIYKHLILTRHKVKNVFSPEIVETTCREFCARNNLTAGTDISIFKDTPFGTVIDLVWNELSPSNREIIWQWINNIVKQIEYN